MSDESSPVLTVAQVSQLSLRARRANRSIQIARTGLFRGQDILEGKPVDDYLFSAQEDTQRILTALYRSEATQNTPTNTENYSLSALSKLDTSEARQLLEILVRAQEAAELVDAQRGNALPPHIPLQPGESRGTDFAEDLSYIVLRLRREVEGARGRD